MGTPTLTPWCVGGGLAAVVLALGAAGCTRAPPPVTNVIVVSLDTLRPEELSFFGYPRPTSPALDRFLSESVVFEHAYAPEPHTLPSHTSLFTSLHPFSHGVEARFSGGRPLPAVPTMAGLLAAPGRETAAFINGGYLHPRFGLGRGFDRYDYVSDIGGGDGEHGRGRTAAETNEAVFGWLDGLEGRPFFLFVHYFDIHSDWELLPYDAPEEVRRLFLDGEDAEAVWDEPEKATNYLSAVNHGAVVVPPETQARLRGLYDAGVRYTTDRLGELFDGLRARSVYDDALVVVVSDHGEELLEHGRTQHTQLYEECLRVVLAVRPPKAAGIAPARRADVVRHVDVLPTILDVVGEPKPGGLGGRSLLEGLRGGVVAPPGPVVFVSSTTGKVGLLEGTRKLVYSPSRDAAELYDLATDPEEQVDLSAAEPDAVTAGRATLDAWYAALPIAWSRGGDEGAVELDEATVQQLQALGYAQ